MASKQTANYGLSQWEATDQVVRLDFNADNAKIDAGMKAAQDTADRALEQAETAYTPANSPFAVGSYAGDNAAERVISLGFTPRAVLVIKYDGQIMAGSSYSSYFGGLAVSDMNVSRTAAGRTDWVTGDSVVAIVEGGFRVSYCSVTLDYGGATISSNAAGSNYSYLAVK